jgi:hypothetical protein
MDKKAGQGLARDAVFRGKDRPAEPPPPPARPPAPPKLPPEIREMVLTIVNESDIPKWLASPLPALGGRTPAEVIRSGKSERLARALRRTLM